jgi:hypothetical protein
MLEWRALLSAVIMTAAAVSTTGAQNPTKTRWVALLGTQDAPTVVVGKATVTKLANGDTTAHGSITIQSGLAPGQKYRWHIAKGLCWSEAAKAEPLSETAPLTVDAQGRGTSEAAFDLAERNLTDYHIDVHLVGSGVVLCGDLR